MPATLLFVRWGEFVFLEGNAFVEGLGAVVAFGQEVEADATDVLLGTEVLEVVHFVALDFEFHQAPVLQAYSVASTEVTIDNFGQSDEGSNKHALAQRIVLGCLLENLFRTDGLVSFLSLYFISLGFMVRRYEKEIVPANFLEQSLK